MEKRVLIITYPWERFLDEIDTYFQGGNEDLDAEAQDQYCQARSFERTDIFNAISSFIHLDNVEDSFYSALEFIDYNYGSEQIVDLNTVSGIDNYLVRYPVLAFINYITLATGTILNDEVELKELVFGKIINLEGSIIVEVLVDG